MENSNNHPYTSNAANYHPIALTSCLCKTMECMANKRLVWFLESNKLITNSQYGFRKQRSTINHVIKLEISIREANIQKQHLIAVFFDLEMAYDTIWRCGIMKDQHSMGMQGRLPNFIKSFLLDRKFWVQVRSTFSNLHKQEEGVPQGSILSVTLFSIKINCITKCLTLGIEDYLYVEDFCITSRSEYMQTAEHQLQQCIWKTTHWANTNGFRISKSKIRCVQFCQLRKMHNDPLIKLKDIEILVVDKYKFFGVIFNRKLTFIPHIKYLKNKSTQAQQLLRVVAHTE